MKKKEIIDNIEEMMRKGSSKEEIFGELGGTDDNARIVAAIPYFEKREKFKTLNLILAVIIFYFSAMKLVITGFNFISVDMPLYLFPITIFVPACAVAFGIGVLRFRGYWYLPAGLLGIATILKSLSAEVANYDTLLWAIWAAIHTPLVIGVFLAFYLKKALCPNLGFLGAKTNESGRYLFLEEQANH